MSKFTSFKAGGNARALIIPENIRGLSKLLEKLTKSETDFFIIGNGTNILVSDSGYSGVIIKIGEPLSEITIDGDELTAGAGALLSAASKAAMEAGLTGMEFASGIPGSVGGAIFMNAGAYESEMKDIVKTVKIISKSGGGEYILSRDELQFSYRNSVIQKTGAIVTRVTLKLSKGEIENIKGKTRELTELRNEKQPATMASAGSFFKRPPGRYAGKLIEDAGLKGLSVGGAAISDVHAGFIVNTGNATATDIIDLMNIVKLTVYDKFGVNLEPEVRIISGLQNNI